MAGRGDRATDQLSFSMRLLLVSQDFPPDVGGIQTYAAELASRLARRCDRFAVLAPTRPGSREVDQALDYPVHRLPARPDLLPLAALPALPFIARRGQFEVAFHAQWQTAIASLLSRRLTGYPKKVAVAAHARELLFNPFGERPGAAAYDAFRKTILRRVDAFFPVSQYTGELLREMGVPPHRMQVIHNGTDAERFRPIDASDLRQRLGTTDRKVLLTVGRLVQRKGLDTTIRALPHLVDRHPDLLYLIAGSGPDRERLEALVRERHLQEHVRFLGRVPYEELPLYYNACDLFVMPSRLTPPDVEGFGIVFLEANACGRPVIGARTGGIPDAVREGETGLLVPPDTPQALASALDRLLSDTDLAARLGEAGRRRVEEEATWDHIAARLFEALARV